MSEEKRPLRHYRLTRPLAGLEEEFKRARRLYVLDTAEEILGEAGRMIFPSKSGYRENSPTISLSSMPTSACGRRKKSGSATST